METMKGGFRFSVVMVKGKGAQGDDVGIPREMQVGILSTVQEACDSLQSSESAEGASLFGLVTKPMLLIAYRYNFHFQIGMSE